MRQGLRFALGLVMTALSAGPLCAQTIDYGSVAGADDSGDEQAASQQRRANGSYKPKQRYGGDISPYIEIAQVVTKEISPGDEVFTYSRVAAGVDAAVNGINNAGSISARYERDFSWQRGRGDRESISGVANGYAGIAPGVRLHAGGFADRRRVDTDGTIGNAPLGNADRLTQFYSLYAGPQASVVLGDVALTGSYRIGYTKIDENSRIDTPATTPRSFDAFEDSVTHDASVSAAVQPDTVLPVGLGVAGAYFREDSSNLDQRIEELRAQVTVTAPVSRTLSVSGAVGYETVEVSSRDALRDADGAPIRDASGRYVTDEAGPRFLAYDVDGLIWDAGVMWRPSSRTSLAAHVGRRYGSVGVYGQFYYAPSDRHAFNVLVYDNVSGFGGQLTKAIAGLPTDFEAIRNPITGELSGSVASLGQGGSLEGVFSNVRSSAFRARGVTVAYIYSNGRLGGGLSGGYDRRKFIAAAGTVLEQADGSVDESFWLSGEVRYRLDMQSGVGAQAYARWTNPDLAAFGDSTALGANASYYRMLTGNLSATAAVGIDGFERELLLDDYWTASALLGMRYSF